jgi:hypothetical protein
MKAYFYMHNTLKVKIKLLEKSIMNQVREYSEFNLLKATNGIGDVIAETILFKTGNDDRFNSPGNYA